MPTPFPTLNPDTGDLVTVDYYDTDEAAALLHVSASTVRRNVRSGRWPCLRMAHKIFLSPAHLARVVELHTLDPDVIPDQSEAPTRLGEPVSDSDLEGVR